MELGAAATPAECTAPLVTGWVVTVELVGSVAAPIAPLDELMEEGAGVLDGLTVPAGADATEGVALNGPEIGLVELVVVTDEPTVEDPVEPETFARVEPEVLSEVPLELLGKAELAVGPTVLELAAAVLAMPFGRAAEAAAGLLNEPAAVGCVVPVEFTVAG